MNEASIEILCRLCLNKSYFYANIYVGQSTGSDSIYETINYVYDLQITIDDQLPEYVCQQCLFMVHEFERYKKSAQTAKVELTRLKRKMHENPGNIREGAISCKSSADELTPEVQENNNGIQIFIKQEVRDECEGVIDDAERSGLDNHNLPQNQISIKQEVKDECEGVVDDEVGSALDDHTPLQNQVDVKEEEITIEDGPPFVEECVFRESSQGERMDEEEVNGDIARRGVDERMSGEGRGFKCHHCGERMENKEQIAAHIQKAHGFGEEEGERKQLKGQNEEKRHICSACDKAFTHNCDLVRHMRVHTGDKPYKCSVCEWRFARKDVLNTHMRIHSGDKRYSCSVCDLRFSDSSNFNRHKKTHIGDKEYKCPVCEKNFIYNGNFHRHMKIHNKK